MGRQRVVPFTGVSIDPYNRAGRAVGELLRTARFSHRRTLGSY